MKLYTYRWKGSDQAVAKIPAYSKRQADFKLGLKKGKDWAADALETGLIHFHSAVEVRPKKTKAEKKRSDDYVQSMWWNQ